MPTPLSKTTALLLAAAALWCICCNQPPSPKGPNQPAPHAVHKPTSEDQSLRSAFSTQRQLQFDSTAIPRFLDKFPAFKPLQTDLENSDVSRHFAYAWYDQGGLVDQAENLYNHVMNITAEGLPDEVPYKAWLDSAFDVYDPNMQTARPESELMLTAQYFHYARPPGVGISEQQTQAMDWFLPRKKIDLPSLLDSLLGGMSPELMDHGYTTRQYGLLKNYLKRYRQLESPGAWPTLADPRRTLQLGDSSDQLVAIKQRLFALGDLPYSDTRPVFDSALQQAVQGFERRQGMLPNGKINSALIRALNLPAQDIVLKIMLNMERCRWVPVALDNDYLIVNIPAFQLWAMHQDSLVFSMNVVVGKALHKTVIFNGDLKTTVFSPYWNVPPDIMKNEILPALHKDPAYLKKQNMEWNGNSIRQLPGPRNALGQVKFLFPNQYHIYLHDSPAKSLFQQNVRAFSHGCIRVAEPKKLAMYLLRGEPYWTETHLGRYEKRQRAICAIEKTAARFYCLPHGLGRPCGQTNLRPDIYRRDSRLKAELFPQASDR